jgi:hypothetical protein
MRTGLLTQSTAHQLADPWVRTQFLSQDSYWSSGGGAKPIFCWWPTTSLIGPISPACDWYVRYLLVGVNPSFFNRHRRGLQLPKALPGLRLSNLNIASSEMVIWSIYRRPVAFRPLGGFRSLNLRLAMANNIQILARLSRVTRKLIKM